MISAFTKAAGFCTFAVLVSLLCACGTTTAPAVVAAASTAGSLSYPANSQDPLAAYTLTGNTQPVHDPSIIRQGNTYFAFTSDPAGPISGNYLSIRCSQDKVNWAVCGSIFPQHFPAWIKTKVPGVMCLWAPDVSYFNGIYHVYYAGSTAGSQRR